MSLRRGKATKFYLGPQASIAALAASGAYVNSPIYTVRGPNGQPFEDDPLLGQDLTNLRDATAPAPGLAGSGASLQVPLCINHLGHWLRMAFGDAEFTEDVTVGFNRFRFQSGGAELPYSTLRYDLSAAASRAIEGFVAGQLSFNISKQAGISRVDIEGMARRTIKAGAIGTAVGVVPAALPLDRLAAYRGVFRVDGVVDAHLISAAPTYNNNIEAVPFTDDSPFIGAVEPGDSMFQSAITVRYANEYWFDKGQEAFSDDGLFPAEFEWTKGSKSLLMTAANCRVDQVSEEISGPGGIQVQYTVKAEQTAAAGMLTVDLINDRPEADYQ